MNEYFAKLAQIESGGNPFAKNPRSSAKGMFQFIDSTAKDYGITAPFGTPEYAQQEVDAVQRFTMDNKAKLTDVLGREPTQGELYLAHQQGAEGAAKILTNPQARAVDLVGEDAIALNAGNPDMTAAEFAQQWTGKFGDAPQEPEKINQETFELELPDGTVLEDIPIGTTKEQIKAKLAAGGYDVAKLEGDKPQETQQDAPEAPQAGFIQRTGEALANRVKNVGQSTQATLDDEQTWGELAFQGAGQGIGAVGDVLGNALISGYRYLPESDYGLGEGAALIGSIPTGGGDTVKDEALGALRSIANEGREFAAQNPRAARNLGAFGNIAAAVIPVKGAAGVGRVGVGVGKTAKGTAKVLDSLIPKAENFTSEMVKDKASQFYKVAEEFGGQLKPKNTTKIYNEITADIAAEGATLPAKTQAALRKVADPEGVVRQATEVFATLKGKPLTLEGFQTIDQTLGDLAYKANTPDDVARKVLAMQRKLRDTVESVNASDLVGGSEGFEAYKKGREIWSKAARMRDLEQITARAFATQQPTNALKGALKRFIADEKNLRGFSKEEIAAITKAADTGVATELVRGAASRLPLIGTMVTNPALAPVAAVGSTAVRGLSEKAMLRKMQEINNLIATGQANKRSLLNVGTQGVTDALGKGGSLIEKAYQGRAGNVATLGLFEQLQREAEREPALFLQSRNPQYK